MSEFTLEQLKTVLDSMADRLDETSGDEGTHDELGAIKDQLKKLTEFIMKEGSPTKTAADQKAFISNFFTQWDRNNPLRDLRNSVDKLNNTKSDNPLRVNSNGGKGDDGKKDKGSGSENPFKNPAEAAKAASKFKKVLGNAAAVMSAVASGGGQIVGFLKNNADAYRRVIASAEGSVTSIMDMRNTAAQSHMTVEQMLGAAEKSEGVRTYGMKGFAGIQKSIRDFGVHTGNFGMTVEQLQDATGQYMDMAKNLGVLNDAKEADMAKTFGKLIVINQDMAAMMGKTRDEARQDALKESTDPNFNASMRGSGLSNEAMMKFDAVLGPLPDTLKRLAKEGYTTHGVPVSQDLASYVVTSPAAQKFMAQLAAAKDQGANFDPATLEGMVRDLVRSEQSRIPKDKALNDISAISAAAGNNTFQAGMQMANDMMSMNPDKIGAVATNGSVSKDAATTASLKIDEIQTRFATGMDNIFNSMIEPTFKNFGDEMNNAAELLLDVTGKMDALADTLREHPKVATAAGAILGGLYVAAQAGVGLMSLKGISKVGKGLFGRGAGAAAVEAGTAAEGAGVAGAAAGAEAGAVGAAGGLLLPAAGVAVGGLGMYYGYNKLAEGGNTNTDKALGYGSSIAGGAAAGAGIGALFGGVGAVPGALIGAGVGGLAAAYSDWTHPDAPDAGGIAGVNTKKPANAGGKTSDPIADMVLLDAKMYDMQAKMWNTMIDIKKYNFQQLEVMREDLVSQKTATDRIARLLEESNRYTKLIQGLS